MSSPVPDMASRAAAMTLLREAGADRVPHSGRTLLDHLVGTADLLASWGAPPRVELAGLVHSVYGTGSFGEAPLAQADRDRVIAAVGPEAEHLADLFCRMDRPFLEDAVSGQSPLLSRDDWSPLPASPQDLEDLTLLVRANQQEQEPHLHFIDRPASPFPAVNLPPASVRRCGVERSYVRRVVGSSAGSTTPDGRDWLRTVGPRVTLTTNSSSCMVAVAWFASVVLSALGCFSAFVVCFVEGFESRRIHATPRRSTNAPRLRPTGAFVVVERVSELGGSARTTGVEDRQRHSLALPPDVP